MDRHSLGIENGRFQPYDDSSFHFYVPISRYAADSTDYADQSYKSASSAAFPSLVLKHSAKNPVHVLQQPGRIEHSIDVLRGESSSYVRVAQNFFFERTALVPHTHGVTLHPAVRIFPAYIVCNECEEQFARIDEAMRQF